MQMSCVTHPDEEAKYFCFDCVARPVCSECVLHGAHSNHDVLHAKKAYPVINGKLENIINGLNTRVDELQIEMKAIDSRESSLIELAEGMKAQIRTLMDDLRSRVEKKEQEICSLIDCALDDGLKELEAHKALLNAKIEALNTKATYIRTNITESITATLTFYADHKRYFPQIVEEDLAQSTQHLELYTKQIVPVSPADLNALKDSLSRLAEEIGALKVGFSLKSDELSRSLPREVLLPPEPNTGLLNNLNTGQPDEFT